MKNLNNPYQAGYDAGFNKPDEENSNFQWFSTPENTKEWQQGYDRGKEMRKRTLTDD